MNGIFKDSNVLADYVAYRCARVHTTPVTNLQLQKMLFFMNYFYLCACSTHLFQEDFEAWKYGPVLPSVHKNYKNVGGFWIIPSNEPKSLNSNDVDIKFIDESIEWLLKIPAYQLVNESHREGQSWSKNYQEGKNIKIPKSDIEQDVKDRKYFL